MRPPLPDYPWDAMQPYAKQAAAHPEGIVDLSIGSPVDPTPAVITEALMSATDAHNYPLTSGSRELREAIAAWYARRRGVTVTPSQVLPTIGSKELVALLPFLLGLGKGDVIVHPKIAYPTYAVSAALCQAEALAEEDPSRWPENTKLIWLNSPSNPTGEVKNAEYLKQAVARAREIGAIIANDECYAELGWQADWLETPTPCILHPDVIGEDMSGVLSVYSLSKQSNLAGYRAAFLAGDEQIVGELLNVRKHAGLIAPAPVQAATVAALADDAHVVAQKRLYAERRALLKPALEQAGYTITHSEAGLYLWASRGDDCWSDVKRMAELGILVGPGEFYGEAGAKFIRLSLTAPTERIASAARRLTLSPEKKH